MNTMHEQVRELEHRLDRAERSARRWRTGLVGAGVLAAAAVVGGAGTTGWSAFVGADVVQAHRIELLDDSGAPAITLDSDAKGGTILLRNAAGRPVVEAYADQAERGLVRIAGETGGTRITLGSAEASGLLAVSTDAGGAVVVSADPDGSGSIETYDAEGTPLASFGHSEVGGFLNLGNAAGDFVVVARATASGSGTAAVADGSGSAAVSLAVGPEGGRFSLTNDAGRVVASTYANNEGRGVAMLADREGQPRFTSLVDADGGAFYLLNSRGQSVVESYADRTGRGVSILSGSHGNAVASWGIDDED